MIEYLSKGKAKLVVSTGSGKGRKRRTKVVTYKTKKELEQMHRKFEDEVRHNPLTDTTVEELVDGYIRSRRTLGVEATTIQGYENTAKRIYSVLGSICAKDLTSYQVQELITALGEKYASKTIRNTVSLLSAAYDNAVRLGQLAQNPCKRVSLPKKEQSKIDIFTEQDIMKFMAELKNERLDYIVAYELALFCGMRRSEILGLQEKHINITFKCVKIEQSRHIVKGVEYVQPTKTEMSRRTIAIPDFVLSDIKKLIKEHHGHEYTKTDYLVQDGFGDKMTPAALSKTIFRIEERAGLPPVSIHDLRHTFASMLNHDGVDVAMISRELGHSNIGTTLSEYTHVFGNVAESSRNIADSLNDKFDTERKTATPLPPSEKEKTAEA